MIMLTCLGFLTCNVNAQLNLALGKRAKQSSNYNSTNGLARLAVDGNTNGNWNSKSVTHTKDGGTLNPWWRVDLDGYSTIKEILIWNRTDCCKKRLDNLVISVYTGQRWERVNKNIHRFSPGIQYPLKFRVNKKANAVKLQLMNSKGILSLAEVQVIGNSIKDIERGLSRTGKTIKKAADAAERETTRGINKGITIVEKGVNTIAPVFAQATPVGTPKNCGGNSVYDIGTGKCWSCPSGYKRTVAAVTGPNACEKPGGERLTKTISGGKGTGLLGTDCRPGYFWDPNGKCYKCPNGYNRTTHPVTSNKACSQKVNSKFIRAKQLGSAGCNRGFYDIGTGKCWTCPSGYKRTTFAVNGSKACEKPKNR